MPTPHARKVIKEWLTVLASLLDDAAVALLVLLVLWLLKIPISPPIILFLIAFFVIFTLIMHRLVIPALRRRKVTGIEGMIGLEGNVVEALKPYGEVKVKGEYWKAESVEGDIPPGEKVEVIGANGLTLKVKRREITHG